MQTREQFGGYVLLKKLSEDPLGETFRAGKVGKAGLERVALLRVFNGPGLDGETLWQRVSGRAAIQQGLKNPNLGDGIDMGQLRGTPYVAYDYVSGKNLAALIAQATQKRQPVPLDQALLIAERIALGLSVASESRLGDERILHGFLVPHLVMISNEGETRLLGFEVAPSLREVATSAGAREQFGRYISPEALAGSAVAKSDDVYSLGAIIFEMLTGKRLPPPAPSGYAAVVDGATLAGEGTPIPAELASLLKKSLAQAGERLADTSTWHKAITKLMLDGHYNPTTFNLAFFMHNLFREDIERETQELQAEKNIKVTPQAQAPVAAAVAPPPPPAAPRFGLRDDAPPRETTLAGAAAASGSNKGLIIGLAAGAALLIGGGLYWLLNRPAAAPQQQAAAPAQPAGLTPEELQAQIDKLVSEKLAELNKAPTAAATAATAQAAQDAARKEEQIKALQKQLEDARRTQPERPAASRPAPAPIEPVQTASKQPAAPPPVASPAPAVPTPSSTGPAAPSTSPTTPPPPPQASTSAPAPAAAAPTPLTSAPAPAEPPAVRRGDLVGPGAGVARPQLISMPNPRYPEIAKRTNRKATVVVPILVDENGSVLQVKQPTQKAGFGFDEAAVEAARRASFRPATKNNVPVKMWMELSVVFKP